jgi:TonB family protein
MTKKWHYRRYLPALVGALVVISIGALVSWMIVSFMGADTGQSRQVVQEITLLAPPPPPPPPKLEEPPPEPEVEEPVEVPEPETLDDLPDPSDEAPPGDALGLDAEGGAGDGFGLVGRKGGRGLLSGGPAWYAKQLQDDVHESLYQYREIRSQAYAIVVKLWIDSGGGITRAELQQGSGKPELDTAITDALLATTLGKPPPDGMPQPVRVRIISRL